MVARIQHVDGQKQCTSCSEWKTATEEFFYPGRLTDGLSSICRVCENKRKCYDRARRRGMYSAADQPIRVEAKKRQWSKQGSRCGRCGKLVPLDNCVWADVEPFLVCFICDKEG